jgi:hypothetical protein
MPVAAAEEKILSVGYQPLGKTFAVESASSR